MYISQISLQNIRCFRGDHSLDTSNNINILVGHNNAGKSTILKSVYHLQGYSFSGSDRTIDSSYAEIVIKLKTRDNVYNFNNFPENPYTNDKVENVKVKFRFYDSQGRNEIHSNISMNQKGRPLETLDVSFDPYLRNSNKNLIYPYFSNRKIKSYSPSVLRADREKVDSDLNNLYAKVDFLATSGRNVSQLYRKACEDILGFYIGSEQDDVGKHAAFAVDDNRSIPITSMGDGVPNILGLIVDLCLAEDKIFLIEEPENDIHPKALKALLRLIEEKSTTNQFFISTHSNVVVRLLGANQTTSVFQIITENDFAIPIKIPQSVIREISSDPKERLNVLEDLGYDVYDYALWKGWLFLEESSAETIINNILIPNFAKGLQNKIRTFSARGFDGISDKFKNFSDLFIYAHLDSLYKNRAWVVIDAGEMENKEINKLKSNFLSWEVDSHFIQLSKHNFEEYYPNNFEDKIQEIKNIDSLHISSKNKKELKKEFKQQLLLQVKAWYEEAPELTKIAFESSAAEVIGILRMIETALK